MHLLLDYTMREKPPSRARNQSTASVLRLLERELFDEITITQICQEAQIARATFYRNFETKRDVIRYMLIRDIAQYQSRGYVPHDMQDAITDFFRYMPYSRELLKVLERNRMFSVFDDMYAYWEQVYNEEKDSLFPHDEVDDDYLREYFKAVPVGLLKVWTERDFRETPEQLAELLCRMLRRKE